MPTTKKTATVYKQVPVVTMGIRQIDRNGILYTSYDGPEGREGQLSERIECMIPLDAADNMTLFPFMSLKELESFRTVAKSKAKKQTLVSA